MRKILLLGAIIISANTFSMSFNGVSNGSGSSYSGGSMSGGKFSGDVRINNGDFTLTLNPSEEISAGTKVTVAPGASFKVVDTSGNVIGTITSGNSFTFNGVVTGTSTSFSTTPTPSPTPTPSTPASTTPTTPTTPSTSYSSYIKCFIACR